MTPSSTLDELRKLQAAQPSIVKDVSALESYPSVINRALAHINADAPPHAAAATAK
jgi:hypothetical protein